MPKFITLADTLVQCEQKLARLADDQKNDISKFIERFANPGHRIYAFQWAEGAIYETVKVRKIMELKCAIEHQMEQIRNGETDEETAVATITGYYKREVIRRARNHPRSTSSLSNMIENYERVVEAEILGHLEGEFFTGF